MFNYDTPWHPDDYIHRIGRTGRAGATGRAFTLVTDDDMEAIEGIEKLTGLKIPVFDIAASEGGAASNRGAVADDTQSTGAPRRGEKSARGGRGRGKPDRSDRKPAEAAPVEAVTIPAVTIPAVSIPAVSSPVMAEPAAEPAPRAPRRNVEPQRPRGEQRKEPTNKTRSEPTAPIDAGSADSGEWNGPVPGFLGVSALA